MTKEIRCKRLVARKLAIIARGKSSLDSGVMKKINRELINLSK